MDRLKEKKRLGIAGLFLVLVLGVGALVFLYILYTGSYNPFAAWEGTEADRYSDPNAEAWDEGHLFIKQALDAYEMGGRRPPFPDQVKLPNVARYQVEVYEGENGRGEIEIIISSDSDARATWTGEFAIGGRQYQAVIQKKDWYQDETNILRGNIAPLKIYEDENGRDKSKLYFITSGPCRLEYVEEEEKSVTVGALVSGWISKDLTAEGKLSIWSFIDGKPAIFEWGPVEPVEIQE